MRRTLSALAAVALTVPAVAALPAGPAAASTPAAGTFVTTTPTRVLDTRSGAYGNRKGALGAGGRTTVTVTGSSGVPSSAAAVALTITVLSAAHSGGITASTAGLASRPGVTTLSFSAGRTVTGSAIVPPTGGRIALWNGSAGAVQLVADVVGYYVGGAPAGDGTLHLLSPQRVIDTRSGLNGFHKGAVGSKATLNANLHSLAGLPDSAGAVAASITVVGPSKYGSLIAWGTRTTRPSAPLLDFAAGRTVTQFAVLPLSDVQGLSIYNSSAGAVDVVVDVFGYLGAGSPAVAGGTQVVSASGVLSDGDVPAGHSESVPLAGHGGVPLSGVAAVTLAVRVRTPARDGRIVAGTASAPVAVSFVAGQTVVGTVTAKVSAGRITLHNTSSGSLALEVSVLGYVPSTAVAVPGSPAVARYPNDLTGNVSSDSAKMLTRGQGDAANDFVLLDLGAGTITPPLTAANPGIALTLTSPTVRIGYPDLVTILKKYVDGLATGGHAVTLAVGTNNEGQLDPAQPHYYAPAKQGADFAAKLIEPLQAYGASKDVTVLGADDIEANFGEHRYADAKAWVDAYLGKTDADLVNNGALNDCPTVFGSTAACAFGWTQAQYGTLTKRVVSGRNRISVLPQVYVAVQAVQWANLSAHVSGGLRFIGSLTEHGADAGTFTPAQGYVALYRALQWSSSAPTLRRAVDISPDA